jgi:hypothetical protein
MAIPTLVRLNGKMFTRNSVAVRINGVFRIIGVDSIEWSDERPTELVPGMNDGGPPVGKATGNYGCTGSIGVYADEASNFETAIFLGPSVPGNPLDLTSATFQVGIVMREDVRVRAVTLVNCNIKGRPSRTVGNDGSAIVMQYELQPTLVLEDGKTLASLLPSL